MYNFRNSLTLISTNQNETDSDKNSLDGNIRFSFAGSFKAQAELINDGFVLLKGSEIAKKPLILSRVLFYTAKRGIVPTRKSKYANIFSFIY